MSQQTTQRLIQVLDKDGDPLCLLNLEAPSYRAFDAAEPALDELIRIADWEDDIDNEISFINSHMERNFSCQVSRVFVREIQL